MKYKSFSNEIMKSIVKSWTVPSTTSSMKFTILAPKSVSEFTIAHEDEICWFSVSFVFIFPLFRPLLFLILFQQRVIIHRHLSKQISKNDMNKN